MKLTQKIKIPIIAAGISLSALAGCSTTQGINPFNTQETKKYSGIEKASIILNASEDKILSLPENYFIKEDDYYKLAPYAGILRSDLRIKKTPKGYFLEGDYSSAIDSNELREIIKIADKNKDKIITSEETDNIGKSLYDKIREQ